MAARDDGPKLAVFDLETGPGAAVALSLHAGESGGGEILFQGAEGSELLAIELDDVDAVIVEKKRTVRVKHDRGRSRLHVTHLKACTFKFYLDSDLEAFLEALLELRPGIAGALDVHEQHFVKTSLLERTLGHKKPLDKLQRQDSVLDSLVNLIEHKVAALDHGAEEEADAEASDAASSSSSSSSGSSSSSSSDSDRGRRTRRSRSHSRHHGSRHRHRHPPRRNSDAGHGRRHYDYSSDSSYEDDHHHSRHGHHGHHDHHGHHGHHDYHNNHHHHNHHGRHGSYNHGYGHDWDVC